MRSLRLYQSRKQIAAKSTEAGARGWGPFVSRTNLALLWHVCFSHSAGRA
jgi:hypothetical protein